MTKHAKVCLIPLDSLVVYPKVQRDPPSKASVRAIADRLDVSALGIMTANKRKDGTYSLLDGQRRKAALEMIGKDKIKVQVAVYEGLSESEEANQFRLLNRSRVVSKFDDFDKGVIAGDPVCVGIATTLAKHKCKYGRGSSTMVASCIKTLLTIWAMDGNGDILSDSLKVAIAAFNGDDNTLSGHLLGGLAILLRDDDVDIYTLIEKMKAKFHSPARVSTMAEARLAAGEKGSMATQAAHVLRNAYESRRRRV